MNLLCAKTYHSLGTEIRFFTRETSAVSVRFEVTKRSSYEYCHLLPSQLLPAGLLFSGYLTLKMMVVFLRNVGLHSEYMALYPRRQQFMKIILNSALVKF
jgi:hypothetical protein